MNCPYCHTKDTKVIDSRLNSDGSSIKRRRQCIQCDRRFTTYEYVELSMPMVIKNDGRREAFNSEKLLSGLKKACQKRPISGNQIDQVVKHIEKLILDYNEKEVSSREIGQHVMNALKDLDPVAYVRFASVYRTFKDIDEFVNNLKGEEQQGLLCE